MAMDSLEAVLRPIANVLNRNIGQITRARELCSRLDGKTIAVRVRDSALAMYFTFSEDVVVLAADFESEPDVIITGSLLTLARIASIDSAGDIRGGVLDLTGDAKAAQQFQELMACARPDIEEELSAFIGDAAAHRLGEIATSVGNWARDARTTIGVNIREYLQEESRDAPSRYEVQQFTRELHALRDDVERAAARLDRLDSMDQLGH